MIAMHNFIFRRYLFTDCFRILFTSGRYYVHIDLHLNSKKEDIGFSKKDGVNLPDPPTNCCFSGCNNCVWLQYAEELSVIFKDAEDKVQKVILNEIDDPNMKAFLMMELRSIKFKK